MVFLLKLPSNPKLITISDIPTVEEIPNIEMVDDLIKATIARIMGLVRIVGEIATVKLVILVTIIPARGHILVTTDLRLHSLPHSQHIVSANLQPQALVPLHPHHLHLHLHPPSHQHQYKQLLEEIIMTALLIVTFQ